MKKLNYLFFALLTLFILNVQVNAAVVDVTDKSTLESCLTGATGNECTLKNDITTTSQIVLESSTAKEIVLNLNGKTLTLNDGRAIDIKNGYSLTVTGNGKVVGGGTATYLFAVNPGASLTLENGTYSNEYEGGGAVRLVGNNVTGTTTSFTLKSDASIEGNYALAIFGLIGSAPQARGVDARIYGEVKGLAGLESGAPGITVSGNIKDDITEIPQIYVYEGASVIGGQGTSTDTNLAAGPAVYAAGRAKWNIMGGTFEGSEALSIKSGEFFISGGTFVANGKYVDPAVAEGSGSEATGAAISITGNDGYAKDVKLQIENATVTSENGYALYEGTSKGTGAVEGMEITSGTFTGKEGAVYSQNTEKFIKGGEFSDTVVEEYLASTELVSKQQEDGSYLVGVEHTVTVATVKNGKVVVDKVKAVAGEKVAITSTPDKGYKVEEVVVALADNSAGGSIQGDATAFIMPDGDVVVTVTFVEDIKNPNTSDSLMIYVSLAILSVAGLSVVAINKKRFN